MDCPKNVSIKNIIIALLMECSKNVSIKNDIIALLGECLIFESIVTPASSASGDGVKLSDSRTQKTKS